jgi:serine/threonine protein kinase
MKDTDSESNDPVPQRINTLEEIAETKKKDPKKPAPRLPELNRTQGLTKSMSKVFTYHKKKLQLKAQAAKVFF